MNVLKKASPDRIKELLRIMNFLAAPFGSQEDLLLSYGIQGQDYSLDPKGNPVPTSEGIARASYVPGDISPSIPGSISRPIYRASPKSRTKPSSCSCRSA